MDALPYWKQSRRFFLQRGIPIRNLCKSNSFGFFLLDEFVQISSVYLTIMFTIMEILSFSPFLVGLISPWLIHEMVRHIILQTRILCEINVILKSNALHICSRILPSNS